MITPEESEKLKEYCEYLIEKYIEINPYYADSHIYYQLKEYYETGLMKDIIFENSKYHIRTNALSEIAQAMDQFACNKKGYTRKYKIEEIKRRMNNEN